MTVFLETQAATTCPVSAIGVSLLDWRSIRDVLVTIRGFPLTNRMSMGAEFSLTVVDY